MTHVQKQPRALELVRTSRFLVDARPVPWAIERRRLPQEHAVGMEIVELHQRVLLVRPERRCPRHRPPDLQQLDGRRACERDEYARARGPCALVVIPHCAPREIVAENKARQRRRRANVELSPQACLERALNDRPALHCVGEAHVGSRNSGVRIDKENPGIALELLEED
eukprot:Amastigsp_a521127_50.p3 type:complete len:169 gc:universal Amastigsp_a521127_50:224-730(+)